jgi:hypothetical protein
MSVKARGVPGKGAIMAGIEKGLRGLRGLRGKKRGKGLGLILLLLSSV